LGEDLLKNVHEYIGAPPLYECMMQEETLILVSDNGAKGKLGSFGWVLGNRQGDRYVEAHGGVSCTKRAILSEPLAFKRSVDCGPEERNVLLMSVFRDTDAKFNRSKGLYSS
jgi:hypothetical protein